jgi:uncharacterized protein YndB with AHSA1/START domain
MTDATSANAVVIERSFDEPAASIWRLWTQPEHFAAWWGPDGAAVSVVTMDVRVGGRRLVGMSMQTPGGEMRMWFTGEHLEVVVNERLVYTESMCDEDGTVILPADMGMPPGHPATTTVTVELREVAGRTTMVLTHAGIPADSPGAAGWQMALDKLTGYVETLRSRSA